MGLPLRTRARVRKGREHAIVQTRIGGIHDFYARAPEYHDIAVADSTGSPHCPGVPARRTLRGIGIAMIAGAPAIRLLPVAVPIE